MSTNQRKAEKLGMPIGTATNRLRKNVMFSLIVKLGEDLCFQCGNRIESPKEMSIEHIEPWLGVSNDLFWDVENISFSHLSCNSKARRPLKFPKREHGKLWTYQKDGCRCGLCKLAKANDNAKRKR